MEKKSFYGVKAFSVRYTFNAGLQGFYFYVLLLHLINETDNIWTVVYALNHAV